MTVDVPVGGDYAVWLRMRYAGLEGNSVWLRVDNADAIKVGNEDAGYKTWKWVGWRDGDTKRPVVVKLSPGQHDIRLIGRESGAAVDSIILTSDTAKHPTD
jgi:hypothetical protein